MTITVLVPPKGKKWKIIVQRGSPIQRSQFEKVLDYVAYQSQQNSEATNRGKINLIVDYGLLHHAKQKEWINEFKNSKDPVKDLVFACADYLPRSMAQALYHKYLRMHYITPRNEYWSECHCFD